jgi:tRNA(fMet)-specific endonuclease VapC
MSYLLDSNICIYIIKKDPPSVFEKFKTIPPHQIFISSISVAELQFGVAKSKYEEKNGQTLREFLSSFEIIDFGTMAAIEYGVIRNSLEKKGTPIGPLDTLIAAVAKSLDFTLVTNNEREFSRVDGLKIENWLKN